MGRDFECAGAPGHERRVIRQMTKHFASRWEERVGAKPTLKGLNRIIGESVQIQKPRMLYQADERGGLKPFKLLAGYLHVGIGIVMKVDLDNGCAVTVFPVKGA